MSDTEPADNRPLTTAMWSSMCGGFGRQAMRDVASALTSIEFKSSESPEGVTRFERGHAKVDLLAPEGIGANAETIPPGYAIQAPGTTQALDRAVHVSVDWGNGQVTVRCPSLLGAIIAKPAAGVDNRHRPHQTRGSSGRATTSESDVCARPDVPCEGR